VPGRCGTTWRQRTSRSGAAISRTRTQGRMLYAHAARTSTDSSCAAPAPGADDDDAAHKDAGSPQESGGMLASHRSGSASAIRIGADLDSVGRRCTQSRLWRNVTIAQKVPERDGAPVPADVRDAGHPAERRVLECVRPRRRWWWWCCCSRLLPRQRRSPAGTSRSASRRGRSQVAMIPGGMRKVGLRALRRVPIVRSARRMATISPRSKAAVSVRTGRQRAQVGPGLRRTSIRWIWTRWVLARICHSIRELENSQ